MENLNSFVHVCYTKFSLAFIYLYTTPCRLSVLTSFSYVNNERKTKLNQQLKTPLHLPPSTDFPTAQHTTITLM